jgi:hypothetical protein
MKKVKLWIGGEIQADIGDSFRDARNIVEKKINEFLEQITYQIDFSDWDCIAIVRDDNEFKEICKYSLKKQEMDFRLKIDYEQFKNGTADERKLLIFQMLLRSLELLKEKGAGKSITTFIDDIANLGKTNNWIL